MSLLIMILAKKRSTIKNFQSSVCVFYGASYSLTNLYRRAKDSVSSPFPILIRKVCVVEGYSMVIGKRKTVGDGDA